MFWPMGFIYCIGFTILNISLVPFAYIIHCAKLLGLGLTMTGMSRKKKKLKELGGFIFYGPVLLFISIFTDTIGFYQNIYTSPLAIRKPKKNDISAEGIIIIKKSVEFCRKVLFN
jgi:hypothetical protein